MTFIMRPSVPAPTGTEMPAPVSTTSWPRTRPSVMSMAMQRTVRSPRCCATSRTSVLSPFLVVSAFSMFGSSPGNCTSTTAPRTWAICPTLFFIVRFPLESLGPGDDLDQLAGDVGLAGAVVVQRQPVDHVTGVARGIVHRGHLAGIEAGSAFQHGAVDLDRQVARQQRGEDRLLARLVVVQRLRTGRGHRLAFRQRRRDQPLVGRDLADYVAETVVDQRADVELAGLQHLGHPDRDAFG